MNEKIKNIISTIKDTFSTIKDIQSFRELIKKKIADFRKPQKKSPSKVSQQYKFIKKVRQIFSLHSIVPVFGLIISMGALGLFGYSAYDYWEAKTAEQYSKDNIIRANLEYATADILLRLKKTKVKRKNLRRIMKELNGEDRFGRLSNFSSCNPEVLAFGEQPGEGNVVIKKPTRYQFVITAYDCKAEPLANKTINLKRPEKTLTPTK